MGVGVGVGVVRIDVSIALIKKTLYALTPPV